MQLRQLRVAILPTRIILPTEHPSKLCDCPALPRRNLGWVQTVPGGQPRNRFVALDRFQRDLGIELR